MDTPKEGEEDNFAECVRDCEIVDYLMEFIEHIKTKTDPTENEQRQVTNLTHGATSKEIRAAQVAMKLAKVNIPQNVYVDNGKDDEYYKEIIDGERHPLCATEAVIARTRENAGMVLAYIGIEHVAFELVFKYFAAQNYPNLKRKLLLPHLNF